MQNHPRIGVGVIVVKDNKLLIGKRKNAHGEGTWQFPGGHLKFGEEVEDCALREVAEETGLKAKNPRLWKFTNDVFKDENKHYVTLFVIADHESGEPKVMEPNKCECWNWIEWENMPKPLFLPIENLLKRGDNPFCIC